MLVGRDRELAQITAAVAGMSAGSGSLLLVAGEPGIGKTRIATAAAEAARERGATSAWGRCWEAGGAPAYWPWREAAAAIGVGFPEPGAIAASDPVEARFALFQEIATAFERAAHKQSTLVVLEDLHAADRSTLLLLEFIAARLRTQPITVLGTYRDLEARLRPDTAESIARLGRSAHVLQLPRLGASDVAALVRETIERADDDLVATVFESTQGNPLFVAEVVRDIRAHGQRMGLPLGVREVIRQRLALLSPDARAMLEAAAVLGVDFARADIARMLPDMAPTIDDVVDRGVLVVRGERLRFSHALYREALYYDLPHPRRQSLHREAALALASTGAPLAELAHHWLEAGPECAGAAVDHAVKAAVHAVDTFAFEDAFAVLERAHAVIPPGPSERALRCRIAIALGESKLKSGDPAGRPLCIEAADTARALGDGVLLAHAGLAYGSVFLMGGVDPVLVEMLERALAALSDRDSALGARVMARLAAARQPSPPSERPRDIELGLAAVSLARRVADRRELLGVLHAAAGVFYGKLDPTVRLSLSREQEALAEELGDTTRLMHARVRIAYDHLELGDFAAYARLATTYEAFAAATGPAAAPWRVPLMRSMIALAKDQFGESERWQAEAQRLADDQPRARRALALHRLGYLRAAEHHAELRAAIPELRGLWLAMPYGAMLADARVAQVLARIGDSTELGEVLARMPDAAIDEEINSPWLADAMWATGDQALARRLEPRLDYFGERWSVYWFDCEIADAPNTRALAYCKAILERWDDSERLFARALAATEAVGRRSLAARMRFELGDLFLRLGHDEPRARDLIASARREAAACGLVELVSLIAQRHPGAEAKSVALPPRVDIEPFTMTLEGEYYALRGSSGTLRFKTSRGMRYLALLVERAGAEVHVLELVGSSDHPDRGDAGELVDAAALRAYRARLETLREAIETAESLGNADAAARAHAEQDAILAELARTTRKGGRARQADSAVDRARSAAQRRIKDALERIEARDPQLGRWLKRSVRTGNYCSFDPDR